MIDDFYDLVDPRTLARHCLSLEPSPFVLHAIEIEEKSEFSSFPFYYYYYHHHHHHHILVMQR